MFILRFVLCGSSFIDSTGVECSGMEGGEIG